MNHVSQLDHAKTREYVYRKIRESLRNPEQFRSSSRELSESGIILATYAWECLPESSAQELTPAEVVGYLQDCPALIRILNDDERIGCFETEAATWLARKAAFDESNYDLRNNDYYIVSPELSGSVIVVTHEPDCGPWLVP